MLETTHPGTTLHHGSGDLASSLERIPTKDLPRTMIFPPFTIQAPPKTDLWRKPPSTDVDNAPTMFISTLLDLDSFRSATVTVSGEWNTLYDQGGLSLFLPSVQEPNKENGVRLDPKWVKTGIEYVDGKAFVGTVATDRWSDWSLVPLSEMAKGKVTIQVEREVNLKERSDSLWVYIINEGTGDRMGIREITWFFGGDGEARDEAHGDGRKLLIGVYGARPTIPGVGRETDGLKVFLEGFEVRLFDD